MMRRNTIIYLFAALLAAYSPYSSLRGQQAAGFYSGTTTNPALAGIAGDGILRISYLTLFPGSGYSLGEYHLTYDQFVEPLHGGVGIAVSSVHAGGLLNDTRLGFSWSYHLRATRELYIFAGLSSGLIYRGFRVSGMVFPDQIDPVSGPILPGMESVNYPSSLFYDMGAGFAVAYRNSLLSADAGHLFRPDLSAGASKDVRLPLSLTIRAFIRIEPGSGELGLVPYAGFTAAGNFRRFMAGASVEYKSLGAGLLWIGSNSGNAIQPSLMTGTGRFRIGYSVRVSTASGNLSLPAILLHQAGITTGLYIVDKRKTVRAINLPEL